MWSKIKNIIKWPYIKYFDYVYKKHNQNICYRYEDISSFNPFTLLQFYLAILVVFVITASIIMGIVLIVQNN